MVPQPLEDQNIPAKLKTKLRIDLLNMDYQGAHKIHPEKIQEYTARLKAGEKYPRVEVFSDGETFWLFDGFHRVACLKALGFEEVEAMVFPGTLDDMRSYFKEVEEQIVLSLRGDEYIKHRFGQLDRRWYEKRWQSILAAGYIPTLVRSVKSRLEKDGTV